MPTPFAARCATRALPVALLALTLVLAGAAPAARPTQPTIAFSGYTWSNPADPTNGQYVIQPYDTPGNLLRITQPVGVTSSAHSFAWGQSSVAFSSSSASPGSWTSAGPDVPPPGAYESVALPRRTAD